MYVDSTGHFAWIVLAAVLLATPVGGLVFQSAASTVSYAGMAITSIWDKDVRDDMTAIGWNPFNSDENLVASSKKVSFYKGVPIFRTKSSSSGSFGVIILTRDIFEGETGHKWTPQESVKHEWGHNIQQLLYGPIPYLINIGIPSAFIDNRDNTPWEIMADIFGGVDRKYNEDDVKKGWAYFLGTVS